MFVSLILCSVGPLVRHWTMRFEAKHQYFKQLARTMGNYVNVCYSLAMRHQCFQCYTFSSEEFFSNTTEIGPGKCTVRLDLGRGRGLDNQYTSLNTIRFFQSHSLIAKLLAIGKEVAVENTEHAAQFAISVGEESVYR